LLLVAAVWAALALSGLLEGFDERLLTCLRTVDDPSVPVGPVWMISVVTAVTHAGDSVTLIILSVLTLAWLLARGDRQRAITLLGAVGGVFILTPLLKLLFGRARPDLVEHLVHAGSASFPSGHTLRSAVVYLVLYFIITRSLGRGASPARLSLVLLLAALIGASRVYLGVHWPSDIVFGWLITGFWITAWWPRLGSGEKT
jgi:undecaprenyl-diphosphatase